MMLQTTGSGLNSRNFSGLVQRAAEALIYIVEK